MIRCPRSGEPTPYDPFPDKPEPSKGGLLDAIIDMLTGGKKSPF